MAVDETPSFFDFLGYMYFCGGTIAGPFFEYMDYKNFIEKKEHYKVIPSTVLPTFKRLSNAASNYLTPLLILSCAGPAFDHRGLLLE